MPHNDSLEEALLKIATLAETYSGKGITEQDTKNALIEPVLQSLGWSKSDLDQVRAEYRHTSKDNPVDYALFAKGHPVLFLEAKALDINIDDHKFISQIISYANVSGVNWAVLTNGREWHLYTVFAKVPAAQKRLFSVEASDPKASGWLRWIMPSKLSGNELEVMWRHRFAERSIRQTLKQMITSRDADFMKLMQRKTGIETQDIAAGLNHLKIEFSDADPVSNLTDEPTKWQKRKRQQQENSNEDISALISIQTAKNSDEEPAGQLPKPCSRTKPTLWCIGEQQWTIDTWRDILLKTCVYLAESKSQHYYEALVSSEFAGRKRRLIGKSNVEMRTPQEIPGGFVEVNLSASGIISLVEKLLFFCKIDLSSASYEIREDSSK